MTTKTTVTHAAHIQAGDFTLVYSTSDDCPPGWSSLALGPFAGRVIVRPTYDGSINVVGTALSTNAGPVHSHEGVSLPMDTSNGGDLAGVSYDPSKSRVAPNNAVAQIFSVYGTDNLPYVVLHPCRYMSGPPLNVPVGLIIFSSNAYAANVCPEGFSRYYANANRVWAIASSGISGTPKSNAIGSTPEDGWTIGNQHFHYIADQNVSGLANTFVKCCANATLTGGSYAVRARQSYVFEAQILTSSASLGIPYIHLIACRASEATPSPTFFTPPSMLFFSVTDTCPSGFVDVTTQAGQANFAGRIPVMVNPPSNGGQMTVRTVFGGPPMEVAMPPGQGTGPAVHDHAAEATLQFEQGADWAGTYDGVGSASWLGVRPNGTEGPPATYSFNVPVSLSSPIEVPVTAYRMCQS